MTVREQKILFAFMVLWMLAGVVYATVTCPAPAAGEMPLVFLYGVTASLVPAFAVLFAARKLSEVR